MFWHPSTGRIPHTPPPLLTYCLRINNTFTWQVLASGAKFLCRAFCSVPGKAHRPGGRHSQLSSHGHFPSGPGSAPDGARETRWRCGMPSCHWVWCTWEVRRGVTSTSGWKMKQISVCSSLPISQASLNVWLTVILTCILFSFMPTQIWRCLLIPIKY